MRFLLPFLFFALISAACHRGTTSFTTTDFVVQSYAWDTTPYPFSDQIQEQILSEKGAQFAAWEYASIGNMKKVHELWDEQRGKPSPLSQDQVDSFRSYSPVPAIDLILAKASSHQIVVINEAHHMPQHRIFTTRLLAGLRAQGYQHLGLEAYWQYPYNDSLLQADGYPHLKAGFYLKEPQFGNLVREALRLGFAVFGYESEGHEDSKGREINQARNIQTYMDEHPGEKVLIHCGFAHATEGNLANKWEKAMAGRLREFTGIDPLTINQTAFSEHSEPAYEHPLYRDLQLTEPTIFVRDGQSFTYRRNGGWFDLAVFHPRRGESRRPSWMSYGLRKEVEIDLRQVPFSGPYLVFAYRKGEEIGRAVPYDVQESAGPTATLVLDRERYEIVVRSRDGKAVKRSLNNRH